MFACGRPSRTDAGVCEHNGELASAERECRGGESRLVKYFY